MGFGSVGYMNTVMKNNRNLLRNHSREKFKRSTSTLRSEKVAYNLPKSTPQSLRQIREKMKFENERLEKKKTIVFLIIVMTLFIVVTTIIS